MAAKSKTNKTLSLEQQEILSENVRYFAALYDKSSKDYKDKNIVSNCWKSIAVAVDFIANSKKNSIINRVTILSILMQHMILQLAYSNTVCICFLSGIEAKSLFMNMKKRYCKKKCDLKKAKQSGTSADEVDRAKKNLKPYKFLSWLDSFLQLRITRFNIDSQQVSDDESESIDGNEPLLESYEDEEEDREFDISEVQDGLERNNIEAIKKTASIKKQKPTLKRKLKV